MAPLRLLMATALLAAALAMAPAAAFNDTRVMTFNVLCPFCLSLGDGFELYASAGGRLSTLCAANDAPRMAYFARRPCAVGRSGSRTLATSCNGTTRT